MCIAASLKWPGMENGSQKNVAGDKPVTELFNLSWDPAERVSVADQYPSTFKD
jgi:hypothetical protein